MNAALATIFGTRRHQHTCVPGDTTDTNPAAEIGPKALRRVRDEMVDSGSLCRTEINRRA